MPKIGLEIPDFWFDIKCVEVYALNYLSNTWLGQSFDIPMSFELIKIGRLSEMITYYLNGFLFLK